MKIIVNSKELEVKENISVYQLLDDLQIKDKAMAVAVDMNIVKKEDWKNYTLKSKNVIEILQFVGGG
jgi:sulfur carrier protein